MSIVDFIAVVSFGLTCFGLGYTFFNSMYIKLLIILILFQILQHLSKLEAVNLIVPKLTVAYH